MDIFKNRIVKLGFFSLLLTFVVAVVFRPIPPDLTQRKTLGIAQLNYVLNDVQRKESDNISYTLVSGLFMVYSKFLTELEGIYYLDPPPNSLKEPFNKYMKPFSELVTNDIWNLLSS